MSEEVKWIVERVEANGESLRTVEMTEFDADILYSNWASNQKRYNDRSVSLIRVTRMETVTATRTNMDFKLPAPPEKASQG